MGPAGASGGSDVEDMPSGAQGDANAPANTVAPGDRQRKIHATWPRQCARSLDFGSPTWSIRRASAAGGPSAIVPACHAHGRRLACADDAAADAGATACGVGAA